MGQKDWSLALLDLSGWLLGQGSDGARESFNSVTKDMSQVDIGEALVS